MKKLFAIFLVCIVVIASSICDNAVAENFNIQNGFEIEFNKEATGYTSIILNDKHYVPMRKVFEKMGAYVFYNFVDDEILSLSRDGDIIRHIVGDSKIIVNGKQIEFENSSISNNDETYIPIDMVSASLCPERISYENLKLSIQKPFLKTDYHTLIEDVLNAGENSNFYPERFQRYISYHIKKPSYSIQEIIFRVNLGLDNPFYENVAIIDQPYELLVLVNKHNKLPSGFRQYNLVEMDRKYTVGDGKQYLLAGVAYEKYIQMAQDAKKEGLSLRVVSAYRTEDYQRNLYNSKVRTSGKIYADNYSARAGHSEHQTGLAVDINSTYGVFEYTSEFKWLKNHAHEYGFILRYPKGKEWITGYSYEPWHYRYVGEDVAKVIYEEGITYEEYCAKYICVNKFR